MPAIFPISAWVWYFHPLADMKLRCPWQGPYLITVERGSLWWIQAAEDEQAHTVSIKDLTLYKGRHAP